MGLDYAIAVYYKNERIAGALTDLAIWANLDHDITSQIPLPDGTHLQVPFETRQEHTCLDTCLFLPEDAAYRKHLFSKEHEHLHTRRKKNLIDVGCIYVFLNYGETYSSLDFTAVTTSMSRYFWESVEVHKTFHQYALRTQAEIALFDIENGQSYPLLTNREREINVWPEPTFGGSPDAVMASVTEEDGQAFHAWRDRAIQ